jgi:hypothetical protein
MGGMCACLPRRKQCAQDVTARDDADQPSIPADGQAADLPFFHQLDSRAEVGVRLHEERSRMHDRGDRCAMEVVVALEGADRSRSVIT